MQKIFWILVVLCLVVGVDAGTKFGMPVYHYKMFKQDVETLNKYLVLNKRLNSTDVDKLMKELLEAAEKNKVPVSPEEIFILEAEEGAGKGFTYTIKWSETVDYRGLYIKTFEFQIDGDATAGSQ